MGVDYSAALVVGAEVTESDFVRKLAAMEIACPMGHSVSIKCRFCPTCGERVIERQQCEALIPEVGEDWQEWVGGTGEEGNVQIHCLDQLRCSESDGEHFAIGIEVAMAGEGVGMSKIEPFQLVEAQNRITAEVVRLFGKPRPVKLFLCLDVSC